MLSPPNMLTIMRLTTDYLNYSLFAGIIPFFLFLGLNFISNNINFNYKRGWSLKSRTAPTWNKKPSKKKKKKNLKFEKSPKERMINNGASLFFLTVKTKTSINNLPHKQKEPSYLSHSRLFLPLHTHTRTIHFPF